MTRVFKLKTPLLALVLSVTAEVVFVLAFFVFRNISEFGTPLNFVSSSFLWFHFTVIEHLQFDLPEVWYCLALYLLCIFGIALIQWYFFFFLITAIIRFIHKRWYEHIPAA